MMPDRDTLTRQLKSTTGWEGKNRLLVQMARELPTLPASLRTESHRVQGCESQVWLITHWQDQLLRLQLDSDSRVIKGLLVLVLAAYDGQPRAAVAGIDFNGWLAELGLARFLSSSRANGLAAIVQRIRDEA
ncbi:SufE family protein [Chitinolyticbacter albus]|uniref:SufE family protein n=1 Tax=Chitinolyticbacter albus TaxID=2961951 RepID=UPI00210ACAF5|nr:SufE family protein [Chitinolyticbacter albus]